MKVLKFYLHLDVDEHIKEYSRFLKYLHSIGYEDSHAHLTDHSMGSIQINVPDADKYLLVLLRLQGFRVFEYQNVRLNF